MIQLLYNIKTVGAVLDTPSDHDTPKWRFGMFPQYTPKTADRFWSKVDRSGDCWLWMTSTFGSGYGQFKVGDRNLRAHRVAWELTYGCITDGMSVLHRCDNRRCVNPAHLWLGTHRENMADMTRKDRAAKGDRNGSRLYPERLIRGDNHPARQRPWRQGEDNGSARLTVQQVCDIRMRYSTGGVSVKQFVAEFGVSDQAIYRIIRRKSWKHI